MALYFGLLTVSLAQCRASLAFFASPEDNKELKTCRDSISMWLLFYLLLVQTKGIRKSMDRNDDGISNSTWGQGRISWGLVPGSFLQ